MRLGETGRERKRKCMTSFKYKKRVPSVTLDKTNITHTFFLTREISLSLSPSNPFSLSPSNSFFPSLPRILSFSLSLVSFSQEIRIVRKKEVSEQGWVREQNEEIMRMISKTKLFLSSLFSPPHKPNQITNGIKFTKQYNKNHELNELWTIQITKLTESRT